MGAGTSCDSNLPKTVRAGNHDEGEGGQRRKEGERRARKERKRSCGKRPERSIIVLVEGKRGHPPPKAARTRRRNRSGKPKDRNPREVARTRHAPQRRYHGYGVGCQGVLDDGTRQIKHIVFLFGNANPDRNRLAPSSGTQWHLLGDWGRKTKKVTADGKEDEAKRPKPKQQIIEEGIHPKPGPQAMETSTWEQDQRRTAKRKSLWEASEDEQMIEETVKEEAPKKRKHTAKLEEPSKGKQKSVGDVLGRKTKAAAKATWRNVGQKTDQQITEQNPYIDVKGDARWQDVFCGVQHQRNIVCAETFTYSAVVYSFCDVGLRIGPFDFFHQSTPCHLINHRFCFRGSLCTG